MKKFILEKTDFYLDKNNSKKEYLEFVKLEKLEIVKFKVGKILEDDKQKIIFIWKKIED